MKVTGNNNAIYINWLTVSWPGNDDWVFLGGLAERCNIAPWYVSPVPLLMKLLSFIRYPSDNLLGYDQDQNPHRPDCFWVVSTAILSTALHQVEQSDSALKS